MPKPQESVMEEVQRKTRALAMTPDAKQLALLAAAEESFCMAASVLKPVLKEINERSPYGGERLETGLHLLEEAMDAHDRYAASLK